jgi:hypothetical protein
VLRDEVLSQTGHDQAFCKRLPGWFMVWFVAGLGLFCTDCYRQIFRWLQSFRPGSIPGRSTLCEARKRLGCRPLLALLRRVVCLLGKPETPGAFYRGMRTMAVDGFVLDVADTQANERAFGRPKSGRALGAFPQARVLALCETGSHVIWRFLSLLTTLLDPQLDPAKTLICLYHECWEEYLTFDEFKTHQRERPVLRSQTPAGMIFALPSCLHPGQSKPTGT